MGGRKISKENKEKLEKFRAEEAKKSGAQLKKPTDELWRTRLTNLSN